MTPPDFDERIHGWIDGELDEASSRRLQAEIESNPQRKARYEAEKGLVLRVRDALRPTTPAPAELRTRMIELLRADDRYARDRPPADRSSRGPIVILLRSRLVQTVAAAAAALVLILVGHSLVTSRHRADILPNIVKDAVSLFDATVRGARPLVAATREDVAQKVDYPTPPVILGEIHLAGFAMMDALFEGHPCPCFVYRGEHHEEIAFYCVGSRMRHDDFVAQIGKVFQIDGYNVLVCGAAGCLHFWVTKLDVDELRRVIGKDYVAVDPIPGIEITVDNICCCGCADRVMKMLGEHPGVAEVRASVCGKVYVRPTDPSQDLRKELIATLVEVEYQAH